MRGEGEGGVSQIFGIFKYNIRLVKIKILLSGCICLSKGCCKWSPQSWLCVCVVSDFLDIEKQKVLVSHPPPPHLQFFSSHTLHYLHPETASSKNAVFYLYSQKKKLQFRFV